LTINWANNAVGPDEGIGIANADEIVMPVTPTLLVVVGTRSGTRAIPDNLVDKYNALQVRAARAVVHHRPGAVFPDLLNWIANR
jgi:hypothetical protein